MDLSPRNMETCSGPSDEEEKKPDDIDLRLSAVTSHTEAVQALRKYLLRKMSSEDSSGDKELEYTPGRVISVAESDGSKLYCSLVQRPAALTDESCQQGNKRCLAKHKSLDLNDSTYTPEGTRYLRTDLCIPVLWSKCSFCDDFFENEEHLRKHLRDSHFQYFLNYIQMRPLTSTKSLTDLPFSSSLQIAEPLAKSEGCDQFHGQKNHNKKPVKCQVCQKCFTTKWNCKQHLKCHAKESGIMLMETDSSNPEPSSN